MEMTEDGLGTVTLAPDDRAAATAAVKARLDVTIDDDDALIAAFAEVALGLAEQFIGRVLIARAMAAHLTVGEAWTPLPAVPVRAIGGVVRIGADGEEGPIADEGYAIDIDAGGRGWIRVRGAARVRVAFTAGGAAGWTALPAALREGTVLLAAHLYRDRAGTGVPPAGVTALWRPFRTLALDQERQA